MRVLVLLLAIVHILQIVPFTIEASQADCEAKCFPELEECYKMTGDYSLCSTVYASSCLAKCPKGVCISKCADIRNGCFFRCSSSLQAMGCQRAYESCETSCINRYSRRELNEVESEEF